MMTAIGLIVAMSFYMLPTMVAAYNNHKQVVAICLLNLLLGWTGLGWIGALIWSAIK